MHVNLTCPKSLPKTIWSFPGYPRCALPIFPAGTWHNTAAVPRVFSFPHALWPVRTDSAWPQPCGQQAQHPPAHLPPSPHTAPLPNARGGMSLLSLLCFARTGWKETTARPTDSFYALFFSQYRLCQIVAQIYRDKNITQRNLYGNCLMFHLFRN